MSLLDTVERLARAQDVRAFEAWLAAVAVGTGAPCVQWAAATVALPRVPERARPTVIVLVGLGRVALLSLGLVHGLVGWRVRKALGSAQGGYLVRVRVTAR